MLIRFSGKFDPIGSLDENFGICDLGARPNVSIASRFVVSEIRIQSVAKMPSTAPKLQETDLASLKGKFAAF
jgi:hypothetical protein